MNNDARKWKGLRGCDYLSGWVIPIQSPLTIVLWQVVSETIFTDCNNRLNEFAGNQRSLVNHLHLFRMCNVGVCLSGFLVMRINSTTNPSNFTVLNISVKILWKLIWTEAVKGGRKHRKVFWSANFKLFCCFSSKLKICQWIFAWKFWKSLKVKEPKVHC